jgi:hypothetical protein
MDSDLLFETGVEAPAKRATGRGQIDFRIQGDDLVSPWNNLIQLLFFEPAEWRTLAKFLSLTLKRHPALRAIVRGPEWRFRNRLAAHAVTVQGKQLAAEE